MGIKVFITDDHYMVVEGIRSLLQYEKNIEWMGHAMNAGSCLAFLKNQQPDIILMDISLPDKNGIELCREVKEKYPGIFIIGLSTFNQESFIQKMMESGASGYVLKNASQEELMEAIKTVMRGKIYFSEEAAKTLHNSIKSNNKISRREREVLELIAKGLTTSEIAEKLFISITTVETHRKSLLAKFETKNTASLIHIATQLKII
jgi:DNA-binding NarL/FixJ family response regulator